MAIKCGTDLVEVDRIRRSIEGEHGSSFLKRVFAPGEIEYCQRNGHNDYESFAARFAAKEAFAKAVGTGICANVMMNEICVCNIAEGLHKGKPEIVLAGRTADFFGECGGKSIEISLSHTKGMAQAMCIIEFI